MSPANVMGLEVRSFPEMQAEPVVFVVDDDVSVRESLELLIRHEGWQVETFDSATGFLNRPRALASSCIILMCRCLASMVWSYRSGYRGTAGDADYFHHGAR